MTGPAPTDLARGCLFDDLPPSGAPEHFATLTQGRSTRVERIVSQGHTSPPDFWYDQKEHELVVVLSGAAELEFDPPRPPVRLETGDWLVIPRHVRHRVSWTMPDQETIWLAVFYD